MDERTKLIAKVAGTIAAGHLQPGASPTFIGHYVKMAEMLVTAAEQSEAARREKEVANRSAALRNGTENTMQSEYEPLEDRE